MLGAGTHPATWSAFQLAVVGLRDEEVAPIVQRFCEAAAREWPDATLWSISTHQTLQFRFAMPRVLFGAKYTAEQLYVQSATRMSLEAGWGLMSTRGFQTGQYLDALLLLQAPWLPGVPSARLGAMVVLLFGNLQAGRQKGRAELIDVFQPNLYSGVIEPQTVPMPPFDHTDLENALPWWFDRVSELLTVALNPANFRDDAGFHDGARHYSVLLSIDRLFAVVNSILVASRRDEFLRKTLMFEGLDIIDGLTVRSGNYDHWGSPARAGKRLAEVEAATPEAPRRLLIPRCAAAVEALNQVRDGFFVMARDRGSEGIELRVDGSLQVVPWDRAVAAYLRLLRNGAHSFHKPLTDPFQRALFSSHNGILSPELADLPVLYLVWLLCNPWQLVPAPLWPSAMRRDRRPPPPGN